MLLYLGRSGILTTLGNIQIVLAIWHHVVQAAVVGLLALAIAETASGTDDSPSSASTRALVIGDSMAICGFGDHFTKALQQSGLFDEVHTYMASGTNPLSWLDRSPYRNAGTRSGYWTISITSEGRKDFKDVYGMRRGYRPRYHRVPKLGRLIQKHQPNVLIVQMGNNLYDLFPRRSVTVAGRRLRQFYFSEKAMSQLPQYVAPFAEAVQERGATLKRCYWIAPPSTGIVDPALADAVLVKLQECLGPMFEVFDSRNVTHYPYKAMGGDNIHFWGEEAQLWSADTVAFLECYMPHKHEFVSIPCIKDVPQVPPVTPPTDDDEQVMDVSLELAFKPDLIPPADLHPYRDELAIYHYRVITVHSGKCEAEVLRVAHPVYLDLQSTAATNAAIGSKLRAKLRPMTSTHPASTWKRADEIDFNAVDLTDYISTVELEQIASSLENRAASAE